MLRPPFLKLINCTPSQPCIDLGLHIKSASYSNPPSCFPWRRNKGMWEGERNVFGSWWWEKREYFKSSAKKKPENTRFQPSSDTGYLYPIKLKLTIPLAGFSKISKQTSKSYSIQHLILETTHGNCQAYAQLAGCVNTLITNANVRGHNTAGMEYAKDCRIFS